MSDAIAYRCTPRQVRRYVIRCIMAGLVPFIQSSPAMGKSAIVKSIANEYNLELLDNRLSTMAPEDLSGLPTFENGKAKFLPFENFPTDDMELPEGKEGWLLFLDEFNSGSKMVQAAAYKLVLDRMVGLKKLHPKLVIVCAGNLSTDRAIVNPLSTAMQSRLVHLIMELDFNEFMEDVAFAQNWDERIIGFLSWKGKSALHDFRPDHNDSTFCSPRTWEFMNKLIQGREVKDEDAALYAGTITSGSAVEFITFTKIYASLVRIQAVVRAPEDTPLPTDTATRYATITHLIEHVDEDSFGPVAIYINRLTAEFKTLFFRGLMVRKPELKRHPDFVKSVTSISRFLTDDAPVPAAAA